MPRLTWFYLHFLMLLAHGVGQGMVVASEVFVFHHENVMGTSLELRIKAGSQREARQAETVVLEEIDHLSAIFSGYDRSSEFSRWQRTLNAETSVSPELFEVLERSTYWMAQGNGSFDPRVQALTELWTRCAAEKRKPTQVELSEVRELMGKTPWRLDAKARTATRLSRCPLSLNGIAKGYCVDRASRAAFDKSPGIVGLLLNVGGDLCVVGEIEGEIGVASPFGDSETTRPIAKITVSNAGVATSGNYQRAFKIGEESFSHVFDPRSGQPVDHVVSATVVAPRLADADALAKIVSVLPAEEALKLVKTIPGVECMLVLNDGSRAKSPGFGRYERSRIMPIAFRDEKAQEQPAESKPRAFWGDDFELVVDFEISPSKGSTARYRRPYVAIWVEDKNHLAVRTLTLWVQSDAPGPRWIPDLKRWYQSDQVRRLVDKADLVETTSRATRPSGKYKVVWNGKDDHGKPLPPGHYTILIEAAREHGTYQIIRKELNLADRPIVEELKGNVEVKSASIEYRRKEAAK